MRLGARFIRSRNLAATWSACSSSRATLGFPWCVARPGAGGAESTLDTPPNWSPDGCWTRGYATRITSHIWAVWQPEWITSHVQRYRMSVSIIEGEEEVTAERPQVATLSAGQSALQSFTSQSKPLLRPPVTPCTATMRHNSGIWRLKALMLLNILYCVAQMFAALWVDSLAMLSDAFHTLSDIVAIAVALYAETVKGRGRSDTMTFGWGRAEVIGGLVNAVCLITLCFYVLMDAIPRFIRPPAIDANWTYIGIALAGFPINLLGALLFCGKDAENGPTVRHAHSHGGKPCDGHGHGHGHGRGEPGGISAWLSGHGYNVNLWAIVIHSLADAFASLFVSTSALLIHYYSHTNMCPQPSDELNNGSCRDEYPKSYPLCHCNWVDYTDPMASVLLVFAIAYTTIPFMRDTIHILMQGTPTDLALGSLRRDLQHVDDVVNVSDLHVSQITSTGGAIGTVRIRTQNGMLGNSLRRQRLLTNLKRCFHGYNITVTAAMGTGTGTGTGTGMGMGTGMGAVMSVRIMATGTDMATGMGTSMGTGMGTIMGTGMGTSMGTSVGMGTASMIVRTIVTISVTVTTIVVV
eukprot:g1012.t1